MSRSGGPPDPRDRSTPAQCRARPGLTLSWLLKNLGGRQPASLEVCTLLRKPDAVKVEVPVTYVGFDIPNEFVIGYGLDYAERYRDLPYIATLKPEVYSS